MARRARLCGYMAAVCVLTTQGNIVTETCVEPSRPAKVTTYDDPTVPKIAPPLTAYRPFGSFERDSTDDDATDNDEEE